MRSLSGIFCLFLCIRACSSMSLQWFEDTHTDEPVGEDAQVDEYPIHAVYERSPSVFETRMTMDRLPQMSGKEKSFDTSEEDPKEEVETLRMSQPVENDQMSVVQQQNKKIKELEDLVKIVLVEKIDQVEQLTKMNNVIFTNVRESKYESHKNTLQKVLHLLNKVMNVKTKADDIAVALRIDGNSSSEVRPILVKFTQFATKAKVLASRYRLRGTPIVAYPDFSELVNQRREKLLPYVILKRNQGHEAFILYDKLWVDGVRMSFEELEVERKMMEAREAEEISDEMSRDVTLTWRSFEHDVGDLVEIDEVEMPPQFERDLENEE